MKLLSRIFGGKRRAAEGEYRPGPYALGEGWLSASAGRSLNWWQLGHSLQPYGEGSAMVEACVSAYAQTVAMCPGDHWRKLPNGGRERVVNSALSRVLLSPNDYQTISDFMLNLVRRLYTQGEAFAVCIRNNRNEIAEMHLMNTGMAMIGSDGSVFYHLGGNEIAERRFDLATPLPARDVLHVRLHTPRDPLKGVSPILSAALDLAMSGAALNQQVSFYLNQARPSFMLETDQKLTPEQTRELRRVWNEQTQGDNAGGTPILTWGLKANPISSTAHDGQLAEMLKMTDQNVALAFRVPLQILGSGATPFASTEALMQAWRATGLGFALNHIEEAFGKVFRLQGFPYEYLELSTDALMRSAFKDRIEGLAKAVQGTLMSPDEARADLDLAPALGGHGEEPRAQMQLMPLSWHRPPPDPAEAPAPPPEPEPDQEEADEDADAPALAELGARLDAYSRLH